MTAFQCRARRPMSNILTKRDDHIIKPVMNTDHLVISATEFKATCLKIFSRLVSRDLARVTVTRRGKPVGELFPPDNRRDAAEQLMGFMQGSVRLPAEVDLTAPVIEIASWSPELPA